VPALEAVLADIVCAEVAERYCLGDLVGYGPDPSGVIERVRATGDLVVRGNYDDGVGKRLGSCGCYYGTPEDKAIGAESYARTDAALDDAEHDYLAGLPDDVRLDVDGARVLLVHGSPRAINEYLLLDRPEHNLAKLADIGEADVVCSGHVHIPYHRSLEGTDGRRVHFVSDGSVGKPKDGDPRACWAELVFGSEAEVREACPTDDAIAPVGNDDALWLSAVFHRVSL
jgi:predicted phosphodiesterase